MLQLFYLQDLCHINNTLLLEVRPTTVSYMNDLNYTTHGMHSWDKSGYSREKNI